MNPLASLRSAFESTLQLPPLAIDWLLMLFETIQLLDDCADGDKIERSDLDSVIWASLVAMPSNAFYLANQKELASAVANMILKWQASDKVERVGEHDEVSFVWRAGYYDVVLTVVRLCHGVAIAHECAVSVMRLYGEKYSDYVKEFNNA
jgi:hypothetical protein